MKNKRTPYRPDQAVQLARIEARRERYGIEHQELAGAADIPLSTYRRIRRRGRASLAQVNDLRWAIRTILKRRREAGGILEVDNG